MTQKDIQEIKGILSEPKKIVIVHHKNADGDYTFAVQSENDKLTVTLKNDSHLPSNFINASWQGYYVTASARE